MDTPPDGQGKWPGFPIRVASSVSLNVMCIPLCYVGNDAFLIVSSDPSKLVHCSPCEHVLSGENCSSIINDCQYSNNIRMASNVCENSNFVN